MSQLLIEEIPFKPIRDERLHRSAGIIDWDTQWDHEADEDEDQDETSWGSDPADILEHRQERARLELLSEI